MIGHVLQLLFSFACLIPPLYLGVSFVFLTAPRWSVTLIVCVGFGIAMSFLTYLMFAVSVLGYHFSIVPLTCIIVVLGLACNVASALRGHSFLWWIRGLPDTAWGAIRNLRSQPRLNWILAALLLLFLVNNLTNALAQPPSHWDEVSNIVKKAKVYHLYGTLLCPEWDHGTQNTSYPPLIPLTRAWMYLWGGESENLISTLHYSTLVGLFWVVLRTFRASWSALLMSLVLAGSLAWGGVNSMKDFTYLYYFFTAVCCFQLWTRTWQFEFLIVAGLALGGMNWVRVDGVFYTASTGGIIALHCLINRKWWQVPVFGLIVSITTMPWTIFRRSIGAMTLLEQYAEKNPNLMTVDSLLEWTRLEQVIGSMWALLNSPFPWLLLLFPLLVISYSRIANVNYLLLIMAVNAAIMCVGMAALMLVNRMDIYNQSMPRLSTRFVPLIILCIGLILDFEKIETAARETGKTLSKYLRRARM